MTDAARPIANADQAAGWDGEEGARWAEHADRYERSSSRFWERFVQAGIIQPTDRVLDIGCGTGRSTRASARIASEGSALGVDLSSQMLQEARRRAEREGLENIRFEQADAQVHDFEPASRDLAISTFGIMFFNDPVAAFSNIGRALAPGGRIAMLAWRDLALNEWVGAILSALAAGRTLPAPPSGVPGPFAFADADHVQAVLHAAGYEDVTLEPIDEPVVLGSDADDAFEFACSMGIVVGLTAGLDEATKADALGELRATIASSARDEGVLMKGSAWLIRARRP